MLVVVQDLGPKHKYYADPANPTETLGKKVELIYHTRFITIENLSEYTVYSICLFPLPLQPTYYNSSMNCVYKGLFMTNEGGITLF